MLLGAVLTVAAARADLIVTTNGAQIVGNIVGLSDGRIEVVTSYAGKIGILLSAVRSISLPRPMSIQLADGTQIEGIISSAGSGALRVITPIRTVETRVADLRGFREPAAKGAAPAAPPQWSFEIGANANGRTGNKDVVGAALSARATRVSPRDSLSLRATYDRQSTAGALSSDQLKASVDYQRNLGRRTLWYVRNDAGYDNVRDLSLYSIAAGGLGYELIKRSPLRLTARGGLSFRYEDFGNPVTADTTSLGADLGLSNVFNYRTTSLVTRVTLVQGFEDSGLYRLTHESYYEVPMSLQHLRVRLGLSHDYNSRVGARAEKLDTTYFAQLVLHWQ